MTRDEAITVLKEIAEWAPEGPHPEAARWALRRIAQQEELLGACKQIAGLRSFEIHCSPVAPDLKQLIARCEETR